MPEQETTGAGPTPASWRDTVDRLNVETTAWAEAAFARGEIPDARYFLWRPLEAFARELLAPRGGGRFAAAVIAGYAEIVRAAKLWDTDRCWRERTAVCLRRERRVLLVLRDWRKSLTAILDGLGSGEPIGGGRGGTSRLVTEEGALVVRRCLRGGVMRWAGGLYFGWRPRPLREFWVLLEARRRGLPVPEPVLAVVEYGPGWIHRGWLVMREIVGGVPLWEFLRNHPAGGVAEALGRGLRQAHDRGLAHPDLNLRNILVVVEGGDARFAFVDLDRARLCREPLGEAARRRSLRRIRRSALRLDPRGEVVGAALLDRVEESYWQGAAE